jgi:hypothetical protein
LAKAIQAHPNFLLMVSFPWDMVYIINLKLSTKQVSAYGAKRWE